MSSAVTEKCSRIQNPSPGSGVQDAHPSVCSAMLLLSTATSCPLRFRVSRGRQPRLWPTSSSVSRVWLTWLLRRRSVSNSAVGPAQCRFGWRRRVTVPQLLAVVPVVTFAVCHLWGGSTATSARKARQLPFVCLVTHCLSVCVGLVGVSGS